MTALVQLLLTLSLTTSLEPQGPAGSLSALASRPIASPVTDALRAVSTPASLTAPAAAFQSRLGDGEEIIDDDDDDDDTEGSLANAETRVQSLATLLTRDRFRPVCSNGLRQQSLHLLAVALIC
jgi:hypothetical protein